MNHEDYQETLRRLAAKRDNAATKLKEAEDAIRGFELAWKLVGEGSPSGRRRKSDVSDVVGLALDGMIDQFQVSDVVKIIEDKYPDHAPVNRSTVSTALMKMANDGEIDLVKRGQGRIGSVFKLKGQPIGGEMSE